ncbi:hypothetical protein FACS1894104_6000 [Actinomycetota bacterium]|nr:hypothetical protein FACS1894104_6000 [Actinomycetota bacterium]
MTFSLRHAKEHEDLAAGFDFQDGGLILQIRHRFVREVERSVTRSIKECVFCIRSVYDALAYGFLILEALRHAAYEIEPDQIAEAKLSEIKAPTVDLDSSDTF